MSCPSSFSPYSNTIQFVTKEQTLHLPSYRPPPLHPHFLVPSLMVAVAVHNATTHLTTTHLPQLGDHMSVWTFGALNTLCSLWQAFSTFCN